MLFAFRGIRGIQLLLAFAALATGVSTVFAVKAFTDDGSAGMLVLGVLLGLLFLMLFGWALRAPTSFVAVAPERTRIRFVSFIDHVFDNRDIVEVRLRNWELWRGLGVRLTFSGDVGLVSAWGTCVELTFREPVRIWLIPRLIPYRTRRLVLSIRNPEKLVERFSTGSKVASAARGR